MFKKVIKWFHGKKQVTPIRDQWTGSYLDVPAFERAGFKIREVK